MSSVDTFPVVLPNLQNTIQNMPWTMTKKLPYKFTR